MRNLCDTLFYINTNVLQDFHICMSVPLICSALLNLETFHYNLWLWKILGKAFQSI